MQKTLGELAAIVDGIVVGDPSTVISGVGGIKEAKKGDITFVANPRYVALMDEAGASAIITSMKIERASKPIIRVKDPSLAFAQIVSVFFPVEIRHPKGIHPSAIISKTAKIAEKDKVYEDQVREYVVPSRTALWIKEGEAVTKGQQLNEGHLDLKELFKLAGYTGDFYWFIA